MSSLLNSEISIRLGCFVGIPAVMSLWEILAPRRSLTTNKPLRWPSNLGLVFLNSIALRVLSPMTAVGVALAAQSQEWGVFNNLAIPAWLALVLAVLALDFAIYLQHVMFHAIPVLWRLHMVHHADLVIGLSQFCDQRVERLPWMLLLPFGGKVGGYPINRDELHSEISLDQRDDDCAHGDLHDATSQRSAAKL